MPNVDPLTNAYFKRDFCVQELRWALQADVTIQPVLRVEDKARIGEFLSLAPDDLKCLGGIDWVDLNRNDSEYWELGVVKVLRSIAKQNNKKGKRDRHVQTEAVRILEPGEQVVVARLDGDDSSSQITGSEEAMAHGSPRSQFGSGMGAATENPLSSSLIGAGTVAAKPRRGRARCWLTSLLIVLLAVAAAVYAIGQSTPHSDDGCAPWSSQKCWAHTPPRRPAYIAICAAAGAWARLGFAF